MRRNGLPESDKATLAEHFIRHGDILTHITMVTDPVYLTEPLVKSENFVLNPRDLPEQNWLWVCQPVVEIAGRSTGARSRIHARRKPIPSRVQEPLQTA